MAKKNCGVKAEIKFLFETNSSVNTPPEAKVICALIVVVKQIKINQ